MNNHKRNCEMSALGWAASVPHECTCALPTPDNKEDPFTEKTLGLICNDDGCEKVEGRSVKENLTDEFQKFAESGLWEGEDEYTKNFGVGTITAWWLEKLRSALNAQREEAIQIVEASIDSVINLCQKKTPEELRDILKKDIAQRLSLNNKENE